ncbi:MAG: methyltransferase [Henriciella sp.]|nr:methyltransferase [Henriciella sp.]
MSEITRDSFYSGRVTVFQPAKGFRAGTDSVLLAAALPDALTGRALDIGCGAGGALLPAMSRLKEMQFTGLERDAAMAELARKGLIENGFETRGDIHTGNAKALPPDWENRFDLVFSNPPFFSDGAIQPPGEGKQDAYLESLPLKDWLGAMLFALRPKGTLVMIHRAAELARILAVIERRTGEITVMPVRSFPGSDAKRVIVKARKGLRSGPMRLLSGIDLYQGKGGPRTDLMARVAGDGEGLSWG